MEVASTAKMDFTASCNENDAFRKSLDSMRELGMFCDATIHIPEEERKLPVHRAIMSSCSAFFRSLFTGAFKESSQHAVHIHGATFEIMEMIVKYAYTNQVAINSGNVEKVFAAADRFNILGLLNECIYLLVSETCAENCIGILQFAKIYNNTELADKTWDFITKNFTELSIKSDEFYKLDASDLNEILRDNKLKIECEDQVFESVLKWVDAHPTAERRELLCDLLGTIRFPYCSEEYLQKKVTNHKDLKKGPYWDRLTLSYNFTKKCRSSKKPTVRSKARAFARWIPPRIPHNVLFVLGGWGRGGVTDSVETYDVHMDQWYEIGECELPAPRAYHGTASVQDRIYVVGGFNGINYLNSVICFNSSTKSWEEKAPMYTSRCYVTLGEIGGIIYAIGGYDGRQRHSSVEKYHHKKNQWTMVAPMFNPRSDAGAASLKGNLYVAGGFDGVSCLVTAEMYSPFIDQWTVLAPMSTRRSGVSLAVCDDKVYAVGGYDGGRRLRSVECLDSRWRHWCSAPRMIVGRSNFSCSVMDDAIYVMGGYDGDTTSAQVERFLPKKQRWEMLNDMNVGRSAVSSCVLYDLPNSSDFTFHGNQSHFPLADMKEPAQEEPEFSCSGDTNQTSVRMEEEMAEEEALEFAMAMSLSTSTSK